MCAACVCMLSRGIACAHASLPVPVCVCVCVRVLAALCLPVFVPQPLPVPIAVRPVYSLCPCLYGAADGLFSLNFEKGSYKSSDIESPHLNCH